jgi:hypothetical protein
VSVSSIFESLNITSLIDHVNIPIVMDHLNRISQVWPIFVYLLIAGIVTTIPFLRIYFSLPNTLFRGTILAILEGRAANKESIDKGNSRLKHTLITYLGYAAESLATIGLFYLVVNQNYHLILYLFIGLLTVAVFLLVRRIWIILWAFSFVAIMAIPTYFQYETVINHLSIFLAFFFLIHSIINGLQVFRESFLKHQSPPESGFFTRLKFIPPMMFGLILLVQSLLSGFYILTNILSLF